MHRAPFLFLLLLLSGLIFSSGCKPEATVENKVEADTRVWVKEAFSQIDVMKLTATFNEERLKILRTQFEQEKDAVKKLNAAAQLSFELLKCGRLKESIDLQTTFTQYIAQNNVPMNAESKKSLLSMTGISYLRFGEVENCLQQHNHESCFLPIQGKGVHTLPYGSENAIKVFNGLLEQFPDDLETQYLLNLAYMTLGKYPDEVPKAYRIPPSWFTSRINYPRYQDIAPSLGINRKGLAGGVIVDDFTNDGWLDIVITSWGPHQELIFYVNNGDGTFSDQTERYGLKGQVSVLHLNHTDFNNDGWLDILLLRGAWWQDQGDIPKTLLMNTGKGSFEDVTLKAGLTKRAASQAAAWADFNLDGWLDLVIANESQSGYDRGIDLYLNQQNGTFSHLTTESGLHLNQFFKGCVATYANDDRYPDIYMSALSNENALWINQSGSGQTRFINAASDAGVGAPVKSFPCWSFDYNNDGLEDLFVSSYSNEETPATYWMQSKMKKADPTMFPKLYKNTGSMTYEEVGQAAGLTEVAFTMGCNFGDINTDGFLDFYLATGNPLYQSLVPNKMYLNIDGKRFEDISYAGGFANVQKGHGVGFGDLDHDGDEDMYVVIGGAFDGDDYYNCLFENPNPDQNNWLVLKLEGVTANKPAIGARVDIAVMENGQERHIHRTVTSGASFGGNSLILEVGLRKASAVKSVTVRWPCLECPDETYSAMNVNSAYLLVQGQSAPKSLPYTPVKFATGKEHGGHTPY